MGKRLRNWVADTLVICFGLYVLVAACMVAIVVIRAIAIGLTVWPK